MNINNWEQSLKNELNFLSDMGEKLFKEKQEDLTPRCCKCGEEINPESPEDNKCNQCCI